MASGEKTATEVADTGTRPTTLAVDEVVNPYKIHIPNKYLEQVKRKLELTRLPHEGSEPKSEDWWEPKPLVEPLIDYWLEKYNWREQENALNNSLPQFRTAVVLPPLESPIRLHFVHVRSPHENALPLLLIPPFPFTNLSFGHLVKPLTDPEDPATNPPFHLVIPSLPGLGFSDALPNNLAPIPAVAEVLNALMARLSYPYYLASGAAPGHTSPAEIDWKLINRLATHYPTSCVGSHFISPVLSSPKLTLESPWDWAKWTVANFFHTEMLGYTQSDFQALDRIHRRPDATKKTPTQTSSSRPPALWDEPNTLAYALCDSPGGILALVLKGLRALGPTDTSAFSQAQLITLTNLAWLPGPEYAMRFWAHCARHDEDAVPDDNGDKSKKLTKPTVAITVFVGEKRWGKGKATAGEDVEAGAGVEWIAPEGILLTSVARQPEGIRLTGGEGEGEGVLETAAVTKAWRRGGERYVCPAWADVKYNVVHTQRVGGRGGGLLAFERPGVVVDGIRGLARGVLGMVGGVFNEEKGEGGKKDAGGGGGGGGGGAAPGGRDEGGGGEGGTAPAPALLESVVVIPSSTTTTPTPALLVAPASITTGEEENTKENPHDDGKTTTITPDEKPQPSPITDKGKGKEKELSPPPPSSELLSPPQLPRDHSFGDGESPDTLVEKSTPSPLLGDHATVVSSQSPSPSRLP